MNFAENITIKIGEAFDLPAVGSWPAAHHRLDRPSGLALVAALAAGRPLLVRGEPGVGKSQLARAAAKLLDRRFISTVIQPNTEYQELLWMFDHTQRLADAQLAGAAGSLEWIKDSAGYIAPGPLWYAFDWVSASGMNNHHSYRPPDDDSVEDATQVGVVLLIDEIDKADISVANGLLEVLGNGRFDVQALGRTIRADTKPPLVILTSNDTRELPAAMVRRCVVLDLSLPTDRTELIEHLVEVGRTHLPHMNERVLIGAAEQIVDDRDRCRALPRTGQAEYLDLLRALDELANNNIDDAIEWLNKLGCYFQKSRVNRL